MGHKKRGAEAALAQITMKKVFAISKNCDEKRASTRKYSVVAKGLLRLNDCQEISRCSQNRFVTERGTS